MNENISNSFFIYLVFMVIIYLLKPEFLFYNEDNKCIYKNFGCGNNKTILNIQIISILLSIFTYFIVRISQK